MLTRFRSTRQSLRNMMTTVAEATGTDAASREDRGLGLRGKSTACRRCHTRKVKCSGGQPCQNCRQAQKQPECIYPRRNRQVKVTQRYIDGLLEEIQRLKGQDDPGTRQTHAAVSAVSHKPPPPSTPANDEDPVINSTFNTRPWFDSVNMFHTPILIGETADAAFATRLRQVISDPQAPEPTHLLRINYATDESLMSLAGSEVAWPSPYRARLLVGAALKYVSRCHHIVRRTSVLENLEQSLNDPSWENPLLRCKLWALFAVGELFSTKSIRAQDFPGMAFFSQASKMLGRLDERPGTDSVEILLLLSFYSMALNRRYSAYILSGTAMRTAIVIGLHLNVPESQLPDLGVREHRTRLFWSAYVFDRMWASKLSLPATIQEDEIEVDMPSEISSPGQPSSQGYARDFTDSAYHVAKLKLASLLTKAIRSVYSLRKQSQNANLSTRIHHALKDLQAWVEDLPSHLRIDQSTEEINDLRTLSLHLSFNQCVILATRPVLLHTLRAQVAALPLNTPSTGSSVPASASALSEACVRCARHSTRLLMQSWIDGSFATFDHLFTQYLFSALTILSLSSLLDHRDSFSDRDTFEEASRLLSELRDAGNCVAQECCHHVDAMKIALAEHLKKQVSLEALDARRAPEHASSIVQALPTGPTTIGMDLADASLQNLLTQPILDMQFLEDSVNDEVLFWPSLSAGS